MRGTSVVAAFGGDHKSRDVCYVEVPGASRSSIAIVAVASILKMVSSKSFIVSYCLTLLPVLLTSASPVVPRYLQGNLITRKNITASTVSAELASELSSGSLIFGPDNSLWANATWRWNTLVKPDVQVVVQPADERDIAKIVSVY